jgi:ribosomal-protein-alanine N-acetyltransferase
MRFQGHIDDNMFAPCGMNCKVCYKHLKAKKACKGCLAGDDHKPEHCIHCKIKECAKSKGYTYCYDCGEFPCKQVKNLDKSYKKRYGVSLVENSKIAKEEGLSQFMQSEITRWTCMNCGGIISLHDAQCSECHMKENAEMSYIFESERLGFRRWKDEDRLPFFHMNSDDDVMKYFPNKLTKVQSDDFVDRIEKNIELHGYGLLAVEIKKTREFIGFIGFSNPTFEAFFTPCVEIGWRLARKHWNQGYATEGARACLDYGFGVLGFEEIYSFTAQINTQSINVMKKIGMEELSTFNHPRISEDHPLNLHVLYRRKR